MDASFRRGFYIFIKGWETSSFRDSAESSLGLVLLRGSGLPPSGPHIWTTYRGFPFTLGSLSAQLLLRPGLLESPTVAACITEPSTVHGQA